MAKALDSPNSEAGPFLLAQLTLTAKAKTHWIIRWLKLEMGSVLYAFVSNTAVALFGLSFVGEAILVYVDLIGFEPHHRS